jgi:hypothetical protein
MTTVHKDKTKKRLKHSNDRTLKKAFLPLRFLVRSFRAGLKMISHSSKMGELCFTTEFPVDLFEVVSENAAHVMNAMPCLQAAAAAMCRSA